MVLLENISFKDNNNRVILNKISLSIPTGSFVSVDGKSDSGKSVLMKIIGLINYSYEGKMRLFGRDISKLSSSELALIHRKIGIVFQNTELEESLNIKDNIILPLTIASEHRSDINNALDELLPWLGIDKFVNKHISTLSFSNIKIIALARAIINRPRLILIDDFFASLDKELQEKVLNLLFALNKIGATVIVFGKYPNIIQGINQKYYLIEKGLIKNKLNNKYL